MNEEPPKDLATRAFQKRVLDEFAAVRKDLTEMRSDVAEIHAQQAAMARNIAALDQRVTSIEQHVVSLDQRVTSIEYRVTSIEQHVTSIDHRLTTLEEKVDARLKETRPIWETVQSQLQRVVEKFDVVLRDIYEVRIDVQIHGRRVGELERRASEARP